MSISNLNINPLAGISFAYGAIRSGLDRVMSRQTQTIIAVASALFAAFALGIRAAKSSKINSVSQFFNRTAISLCRRMRAAAKRIFKPKTSSNRSAGSENDPLPQLVLGRFSPNKQKKAPGSVRKILTPPPGNTSLSQVPFTLSPLPVCSFPTTAPTNLTDEDYPEPRRVAHGVNQEMPVMDDSCPRRVPDVSPVRGSEKGKEEGIAHFDSLLDDPDDLYNPRVLLSDEDKNYFQGGTDEDGILHGNGRMLWSDGTTSVGTFLDGELVDGVEINQLRNGSFSVVVGSRDFVEDNVCYKGTVVGVDSVTKTVELTNYDDMGEPLTIIKFCPVSHSITISCGDRLKKFLLTEKGDIVKASKPTAMGRLFGQR